MALDGTDQRVQPRDAVGPTGEHDEVRQNVAVALGETIVAALAGLAGAGVGAWATSRAATVSARQAEVTAARAELAAVYELIWTDHTEQRKRLAMLRYRLAHLRVPPEDLTELMSALDDCTREIQKGRMAVEEGLIDPEDAGIAVSMIERATQAADKIALGLSPK